MRVIRVVLVAGIVVSLARPSHAVPPPLVKLREPTPTDTLPSRVTHTPTRTPTSTPSLTFTVGRFTATNTRTATASASPTETLARPTPIPTGTPTLTATATATVTRTDTPITPPTRPPTATHSPTVPATPSPSLTATRASPPTPTATASETLTPTHTPSATASTTATYTSSRTRTRTPTRTRTRTPAGTATPIDDLVATALEVTQSVQNLNNTVRLVAGKRTFVRFHVRSTKNVIQAGGRIVVEYGVISKGVLPINKTTPAGYIKVQPNPDRSVLDHAFLFELPSFFTSGTVTIKARVNPGYPLPETTYANNDISTTVKFEPVPGPSFVLYALTYKSGDYIYPVPVNDLKLMLKWIKAALPVNDIEYWIRQHGFSKHPSSCKKVNAFLMSERKWDLAHGKDKVPGWARYYGMVPDGGGFMHGCSGDIPSSVASGPTGPGSQGWDFDGSYGDWYGGHELGHTFGRSHAEYCGAKDGKSYPYSKGRISKTLSGPTALYGFNAGRLEVYGPDWTDVMTYCPYEWISDFTHHGIMNYLQDCMLVDYLFPDSWKKVACFSGVSTAEGAVASSGDRLVVVGSIDPVTNEVVVEPLFVIPVDGVVPEPIPGDYAIVLRDADGAPLARYPFTPSTGSAGRGTAALEENERDVATLFIDEMVPFVEGTMRVDIEGPGGVLLHSVSAGAAQPQVKVQSPNGGEVFDGTTIPVTWSATDADGDRLVFQVEYSRDNGTSWESVAREVTETSIELDASMIPGGAQALIRVWASDGIHTASDVSDASFTVPNHPPQVTIVEPANGAVFAAEQPVTFEADGYDVEAGSLSGARLLWRSDRDGALDNGSVLTTADLSVGVHTITVEANDGEGGVARAAITIEIVADPAEVPPPPDALKAEPLLLSFEPNAGRRSARLFVDNPAGNSLRWRATASERWVQLSHTEGTTPDEITVALDDAALADGTHTAAITATSDDLPDMAVRIPVEVTIGPFCTGDCDDDGTVTVDELVAGVTIALGNAPADSCPSFDVNADDAVTVDELVVAVNDALNGCS